MTFCEARVQVGFPDYLLVDMGIFELAAWFKAMRERLGDTRGTTITELDLTRF